MMVDTFERDVRFSLPQWPTDTGRRWSALAERAADVAEGKGHSGERFADIVAHVRGLLAQGAFDAVADRLDEQRFLRALLTVWATDDLAWMSMPRLFPMVRIRLTDRPRRQTATILAAMFWRVFDRFDGVAPGLFDSVADTLFDVAQRLVDDDGSGPLRSIAVEPQYWLSADAPNALAEHLTATGRSLDDHLRDTGVAGMEGRFGILTRRAYYLAAIAHANHTTGGHSFLEDVARDAVKAAETEDDLSFGHALLTALCDKPADLDPSREWLEAITGVGGDARLQDTSQWQRWWRHVPEHLVRRAVRWMAGADLSAYFEALDDYAKAEGKEGMRRMLPKRITFLRGLYRSGLVRDARLILGAEVRRGMRQRLGGLHIDAPLLVGPSAPTTAVVVLVCEGFTVVEGSHNFQLYLYKGDPDPMLVDRRRRHFDAGELKQNLPARHLATHGQGSQDQYRHNTNWQPKAIQFLRGIGVNVDPHAVLSKEDVEHERLRNLNHRANRTSYRTPRRRWFR